MVAERVGSETMLSPIVQMVATAQRSRAPIQGMADRVAAWFVPLVVEIAIITFIVWALIGPEPSMIYAIVSAVSVLIIAYPCALGLATPMSIMTATGRGAQAGVVIKDAEALERFAKIDTLIVGLGVLKAAGVLYPVLGVQLSPMRAAAAMSLSSVSVIINAL